VASALSGICQNEVIVPPPLAIRHSVSSRSRLCCRKRSRGCALSPTSQLLPREDETVENTIDFHSVSYHRIYINAVVSGSVVSELDAKCGKIYSILINHWKMLRAR
jgi:hypothetical protein